MMNNSLISPQMNQFGGMHQVGFPSGSVINNNQMMMAGRRGTTPQSYRLGTGNLVLQQQFIQHQQMMNNQVIYYTFKVFLFNWYLWVKLFVL